MKMQLLTVVILTVFLPCQLPTSPSHSIFMPPLFAAEDINNTFHDIRGIPPPDGYHRSIGPPGSFENWLRCIRIRKSNTVFLYNHLPKPNQQAQFAVLDISVGNEDLQQCADAVMRLKAEYLYQHNRVREIEFRDNNNKRYSAVNVENRKQFDDFLHAVFSYCGTASLERQLLPVTDIKYLQPGDVLIKGGYPGHAMIIVDMAENAAGKKVFLFAQSFMPAQDIHIVKNRSDATLNPWYEIHENQNINTPEWTFTSRNFRKWP